MRKSDLFFKRKIFKVACIMACALLAALEAHSGMSQKERDALVLQPKHHDIFYGKADRLYLDGFWKFKEAVNFLVKKKGKIYLAAKDTKNPKTDVGLQEKYYEPKYDDSSWSEMLVPWPWNVKFPCEYKPRIVARAFAGVGYYRRELEIPADKMNKELVLHFSSVQTECEIWVNGSLAGKHKNLTSEFGPIWRTEQSLWLDDFSINITKFVHPGKNTLVLRVYDDGLPIMYNNEPDHGGILGPVWLDFNNKVYASEILASPEPAESKVDLSVKIENFTDKAQSLELTAEIVPFESESYTPPQKGTSTKVSLGEVKIPKGESSHNFNIKINNPVLWDIDCPFLYHLRLLANGKLVGQTRFGMRKFEVNGKRFSLNGHPINLRGVNPEAGWDSARRIMAFNKADYLRNIFKLYKEIDISFVRNHSGPSTKILYDICDELGIVLEDDFSPSKKFLAANAKNIKIEYIANVSVNSYFAPDGKFTPEFKERLKKWVKFLHNHPSVCMFTGGNELGAHHGATEEQITKYIDNFYDVVKEQDLQKRPITASSGLCIYNWNTPVKADFFDHHRYADWSDGWMDCVVDNKKYTNTWETIYGKKIDKPVINGEFGSYFLTEGAIKKYRFVNSGNAFDKEKFIKWTNDARADSKNIGYWKWLVQRFFTTSSVRSLITMDAYKKEEAKVYEKLLRVFRRDMPFYEGFVVHAIKPSGWGYSYKEPLYTEEVVQRLYKKCSNDPDFKSLKKSFAPIYAALDMYDRNIFAGDALNTKLFFVNNKFKTNIKKLNINVLLENSSGKVLNSQTLAFEDIKEHARVWRDLSIPISKKFASGNYTVHVQVEKNGKILNEYIYPLFIMGPEEFGAKIKTDKKVALYDCSEKIFRGLVSASPSGKLLKSAGLNFTKIENFDELNKFDLLIIGANSFDSSLINDSTKIRSWLENGGRILALEQCYDGPIPFLNEMRLLSSGDMFFADLVDEKHPISKNLKGLNFELWNGKRKLVNGALDASDKKIYDSYITPVPEGSVITGGERQGRYFGNQIFGMIAGEIKVGKGLVFFSQAQACRRYDTDSIARRYLHNLLEYVSGDKWTGDRAKQVKGKKVEFIDSRKCFFVNLKTSANKGFSDEVKNDKKGGWTDDGPNDLRAIKKGDVVFMGVPYHVLDDSEGKSGCMVLMGTHRPYFPEKITGISVNKKAKRLFFLQASAWSGGVKGKIGEYKIHYADGTETSIDLIRGQNIDEWWGPSDLPQAVLAYKCKNLGGAQVGVFSYPWNNPYPGKTIKTIDFISSKTDAIPICLAITGEE